MKWQRPVVYGCLGVVALVALLVPSAEAYRDKGFICENTGSRKGYREWPFAVKTGEWYETSPLEQWVSTNAPDALVHHWTCYTGTGYGVLGNPLSSRHGRPGPMIRFTHGIQREWIERADPVAIRRLYDLLVTGDRGIVETEIDRVLTGRQNFLNPKAMQDCHSSVCRVSMPVWWQSGTRECHRLT